jgi:nucleotide-binding universal stress UspA family protein
MKNVIVGVNDREEALDALRLAREIAVIERARLICASAFVSDPPRTDLSFHDARTAFYESAEARAHEALWGLTHEFTRIDDAPTRVLQVLAEDRDAYMVVVGSTHRGPMGRVLPGTVAERLLQGAPCPVAVAPRGYAGREHPGIGLIGVGYDGRPESEIALKEAVWMANEIGAELKVISVACGRDRLEPAIRVAEEAGADVYGCLRDGSPAAELANEGVELDLLVMGSRARGSLRRVILGSTSSEVIRTAPCPVVVVPRGAEERVVRHEGVIA